MKKTAAALEASTPSSAASVEEISDRILGAIWEHRLPPATRKSMTVRFAMAAAQRINRLVDPQGHGEF